MDDQRSAFVILKKEWLMFGVFPFLIEQPFKAGAEDMYAIIPVHSVKQHPLGIVVKSSRPDTDKMRFSEAEVLIKSDYIHTIVWYPGAETSDEFERVFGFKPPTSVAR